MYTKPLVSNTALAHEQLYFLGALSPVLRDAAPEDFYIFIQVFLRYSKEQALVSRLGPFLMLSCAARPAGSGTGSAPFPGGGSSPSPVAPSILPGLEGSARRKGHTRYLPSISCTFLQRTLGFSFFLSFSPPSPIPSNNYFGFLFPLGFDTVLRGSGAAPLPTLSPFSTHSG